MTNINIFDKPRELLWMQISAVFSFDENALAK